MIKITKGVAATPRIPTLIIHGGAGVGSRKTIPPEVESTIRRGLREVLEAGHADLARGASALDIAENAVRRLEDNPLFNAGKGGALTSEATIEHDAAIMDGRSRRAGAVAGVRRVRNPITAARAVMERSPHIMLAGLGAEQFAREQHLDLAPEWYFFTEQRLAALERVKRAKASNELVAEQDLHGTVGAIALDVDGNLAAATSTGGRANKLPGRIGDSPIIGAGTYADNRYCALSGTGDGEYFIRLVLAHRVADLMELAGLDLVAAIRRTLTELKDFGGSGGLVAIDHSGNAVASFTGVGMHRGYVRLGGDEEVAIFADDPFSPDHALDLTAMPTA